MCGDIFFDIRLSYLKLMLLSSGFILTSFCLQHLYFSCYCVCFWWVSLYKGCLIHVIIKKKGLIFNVLWFFFICSFNAFNNYFIIFSYNYVFHVSCIFVSSFKKIVCKHYMSKWYMVVHVLTYIYLQTSRLSQLQFVHDHDGMSLNITFLFFNLL